MRAVNGTVPYSPGGHTTAGSPSASGTHEAPHQPSLSRAARIPGSVRSRRPNPPRSLKDSPAGQKILKRIQKAQSEAAIEHSDPQDDAELSTAELHDAGALAEPPPLTSDAGRRLGWIEWAKSLFQSETPGPTCVAIVRFEYPAGSHEAPSTNEEAYVDTLRSYFGRDNVHIIDNPDNDAPFARNLGTFTPDGKFVTSAPISDNGMDSTRDKLERHFESLGFTVERLTRENENIFGNKDMPINFANVEYIPSKDALILASRKGALVDAEREKALRRVFGDPQNVLRIGLDGTSLLVNGAPRFYDLDLCLHVAYSKTGNPVLLLHKPCLRANGIDPEFGAEEFVKEMKRLGVPVIEMEKSDQQKLAANAISSPHTPGKIFLTRDGISKRLVRRLREEGVEPQFPEEGMTLGLSESAVSPDEGYVPFGLHCVTLNFRCQVKDEPKDPL